MRQWHHFQNACYEIQCAIYTNCRQRTKNKENVRFYRPQLPPPSRADTPMADTPRQTPPRQTATAAGGTHPTGMHSCYVRFRLSVNGPWWCIHIVLNWDRNSHRKQMGYIILCRSFRIASLQGRGWELLSPIVFVPVQFPVLVSVPFSMNTPLEPIQTLRKWQRKWKRSNNKKKRMYSSRMHTARSLTVCRSIRWGYLWKHNLRKLRLRR